MHQFDSHAENIVDGMNHGCNFSNYIIKRIFSKSPIELKKK